MEDNFKIAEKALNCSQQGKFPKYFTFENRNFVLYKNVFSPITFKGSSVYIPHLPLKEGQSFFDMGCGCGIIGIMACLKYKLKKVVCADINGYAVKNTNRNIKLHNLNNKVTAIKSDVFANVPLHQKFDLLFWNAPYFDGDNISNNILYKAMYDKEYYQIKKFILDGQNYLKPKGRIMLGFSSDKFPLKVAKKLINDIGFDIKIYYQETDALGYKQEILEVIRL